MLSEYTDYKNARMQKIEPLNKLWSEITGLDIPTSTLKKQKQDIDRIFQWCQQAVRIRKRNADEMSDEMS